MKIPQTHQPVMPYLILHDADGFIAFTKKVFDAVQNLRHLREDNKTVMHAELMISGNTIMLAEAAGQWKVATANLFVYVDNADESYRKALAAGASSLMEPNDQSYGRACGITDAFGNVWWITSVNG